jgi:hypothetical protein
MPPKKGWRDHILDYVKIPNVEEWTRLIKDVDVIAAVDKNNHEHFEIVFGGDKFHETFEKSRAGIDVPPIHLVIFAVVFSEELHLFLEDVGFVRGHYEWQGQVFERTPKAPM